MKPTDTQDQAAAESDYPPSSVFGQDGHFHEICPFELMIDSIDKAALEVVDGNLQQAFILLVELRRRLHEDAALYERMFIQSERGHEYVRQ